MVQEAGKLQSAGKFRPGIALRNTGYSLQAGLRAHELIVLTTDLERLPMPKHSGYCSRYNSLTVAGAASELLESSGRSKRTDFPFHSGFFRKTEHL
jgi:hypothetical protein